MRKMKHDTVKIIESVLEKSIESSSKKSRSLKKKTDRLLKKLDKSEGSRNEKHIRKKFYDLCDKSKEEFLNEVFLRDALTDFKNENGN